ncbi:TSUP family transporter [Paracraurococcus ruber]|uniref:Probable membrane transporter protein n=1 Tax=Paracraurococcus ruber TaxID=77675 RepID=A0ABS1D1E9_9PROT|nr:TSUP family transporter [Paracraurococcus ruber]MBK1660641.1 permease [Paracraurococcus ruber]TDG27271.1 sulfite exporter TauE/SafE family protein [Paracraurococcus ruber]
MPPTTLLLLACVMVFTALLSGIFGMAGGLVLVGVLLALLPLPEAMALHAVTQMASNGWRGILWRRHVAWRPVAWVLAGYAVAMLGWSLVRWVPDKPLALIALGGTPFLAQAMPEGMRPDPDRPAQALGYGAACMSLLLLTGVSGPLLDRFFLGGGLDRRAIVATKAACQLAGHGLKLLYFGALVADAGTVAPGVAAMAVACSMLGTTLARRVLEAMSDAQYRRWTGRLIATVSGGYLAYGGWLLLVP